MRCIILSSVAHPAVPYRHVFREKYDIGHLMRVFIFSATFV